MRIAVLLFLFLCWHMPGNCSIATASDFHCQRIYAPAQGMENVRQVSTADANPDLLATECSSLAEDSANFISAEDDEEEDSSRKYISLARDALALHYAFLINHYYSCPAQRLSPGKHASYLNTPKYIIQSVFRI